jgi:glycosyltransferase involved in cell wall biosynthesis
MKLIIQIPCFNEEQTLPAVLSELPKKIEGIDRIETLVIDDGSSDGTAEVARSLGVDHIVSLPKRRGLAFAFKTGLDKATELGADIIVNTDGDNQYNGADIALLTAPIIAHSADIVIGCRNIETIKHFSALKKVLQRFGSFMVRQFSGADVGDATSGFRAYSREAALSLNIFSTYTYTIETIIQAGKKNIAVACAPIRTNKKLRESRLISSIPSYLVRSISTMLRIYLMYEPLKSFFMIGSIFVIPAAVLVMRFFYFYFTQTRSGHVQSLIIAAVLAMIGLGVMLLGLIGNIISVNRRLLEEVLYRVKKRDIK